MVQSEEKIIHYNYREGPVVILVVGIMEQNGNGLMERCGTTKIGQRMSQAKGVMTF